jgi:hypothetical protein
MEGATGEELEDGEVHGGVFVFDFPVQPSFFCTGTVESRLRLFIEREAQRERVPDLPAKSTPSRPFDLPLSLPPTPYNMCALPPRSQQLAILTHPAGPAPSPVT